MPLCGFLPETERWIDGGEGEREGHTPYDRRKEEEQEEVEEEGSK